MAEAVEAAENAGVKVDWFDKGFREFLKAKDHQKLAHTITSIKEHMEDLQRKLDMLEDGLKQVENEMDDYDIDHVFYGDYMVCLFFFWTSIFVCFSLFYLFFNFFSFIAWR